MDIDLSLAPGILKYFYHEVEQRACRAHHRPYERLGTLWGKTYASESRNGFHNKAESKKIKTTLWLT